MTRKLRQERKRNNVIRIRFDRTKMQIGMNKINTADNRKYITTADEPLFSGKIQ